MIGIKRNIFVSALLHAAVIISALALNGIAGDALPSIPGKHMMVSLFEEVAGIVQETSKNRKTKGDKTPAIVRQKTSVAPVVADNDVIEQPGADRRITGEKTAAPATGKNDQAKVVFTAEDDNRSEASNHTAGDVISPFGGKGGFSERDSTDSSSRYALIRASIERAKIYPLVARKKRIEGTVLTEFTINANGVPENITVRKSSGSGILDSTVTTIIRKAAPFPAVEGRIVIPITFSMTDLK